jgi:hypothetical protein
MEKKRHGEMFNKVRMTDLAVKCKEERYAKRMSIFHCCGDSI